MTENRNAWGCLLPFDTDDEQFSRGVEVGRIWEILKSDDGEVAELVHASNAEMILRLAEAVERSVQSEELGDGWLLVTFAETA